MEAGVGTRFSFLRNLEASVLSEAWRIIIPEYFSPIVCLIFLEFVVEFGG